MIPICIKYEEDKIVGHMDNDFNIYLNPPYDTQEFLKTASLGIRIEEAEKDGDNIKFTKAKLICIGLIP